MMELSSRRTIMVSTKTSRKGTATAGIMPPPKSMSASESALAIALRKVDMKGAVQAAIAFAQEMFPQAKDILLEEVEAKSGGWSVVISFVTGELSTLSQVMGGGARLFKTITIDSASGKAQSLKVWKQ
jgi:hypothetical protein